MNWIPMKEKQPTKGGYYLITYKGAVTHKNHVFVDYWDNLGEFFEIFKDSVLAWTKLPEPYREAQNG